MITKVRNLRQSFEYEANFEQDINNTTGLTFAFFAGEAYLQSGLTDIVAGTIAVPTGEFAVWLDVQTPATPTIKGTLLSGVNSEDSIILFTGTASATEIDQSTVVDHRSFTTGQRGLSSSAVTFNLTNDPEASPLNEYWAMRAHMATWDDTKKDWTPGLDNERQTANLVFDEAAGETIRAIGVSLRSYNVNGSPTRSVVGPTFAKGNAVGAWEFDGTSDWVNVIGTAWSSSATGVYYGWVYPNSSGSGNGRIVMGQSNSTGSISGEWGISAADEVFFQIFSGANKYRLEIDTPNIVHNTWNFVVIVQRGDGNGAQIWWNGTLYNKDTGNTTETLNGTATRDWWWAEIWAAVGRTGHWGARGDTSASFKFEGRLFDTGLAVPLVASFPDIWPNANVDKLMRSAGF